MEMIELIKQAISGDIPTILYLLAVFAYVGGSFVLAHNLFGRH